MVTFRALVLAPPPTHTHTKLYTVRILSDIVTQNPPSQIALTYVTIKYPSINLVSADSVDRN
jgi:hypothetical protein